MLELVLLAALSASWSDPAGTIRCEVPQGFRSEPDRPWRHTRSDGLRELIFLTVRPVAVSPLERARQLLERLSATDVSVGGASAAGTLGGPVPVQVVAAVRDVGPGWVGLLLHGPVGARLGSEVEAILATCRRDTPPVHNGRVYDSTRRLSAHVPFGHDALELRGAGAVQRPGYSLRMSAVTTSRSATLEAQAIEQLTAAGARLNHTSAATAGPGALAVAIASGELNQNGTSYLVEMAVIDLGNGEIGGIGLSSDAPHAAHARATLTEMLGTLTCTAAP